MGIKKWKENQRGGEKRGEGEAKKWGTFIEHY